MSLNFRRIGLRDRDSSAGYRSDGALEFLAYPPDGELINLENSKQRRFHGRSSALYMRADIDSDTGNYTVVFPDLGHSHSAR